MKTISLSLALLVALLAGCATPSSTSSSLNAQQEKRMNAFIAKMAGRGGLVMVIPSSNNFISNQMIIASIKTGADVTAVVNLVKMLKQPKTEPIAVIGDNDAVTAATIEASLKRLQGFKPSAKLYFVGEASYGEVLQAQADAAGVNFEAIVYP